MIIDFHTHTFPDNMAEKTISTLSRIGGITPHRNGTVGSLIKSMATYHIDYSVVLPIATAAKQVNTINRISYEENRKNNLFFAGTIHPDTENVEEVLEEIKAHGLFGIKIHPDYQNVYFNDPRYIRILTEAAKRDLVIVTHAGRDIGFPDDVHCTADRVLDVMDKIGDLLEDRLVLAHMGACDQPEEALTKLAGLPVYLDTAFVLDRYPHKVLDIIHAHGSNRILFATDSPWSHQGRFVEILNSMDLTEEERENIFYKNGKKLLSL